MRINAPLIAGEWYRDGEQRRLVRNVDWRVIRRVFDAAMKAGAEVRGTVASDVARTALAHATIKARAHFSKREKALA